MDFLDIYVFNFLAIFLRHNYIKYLRHELLAVLLLFIDLVEGLHRVVVSPHCMLEAYRVIEAALLTFAGLCPTGQLPDFGVYLGLNCMIWS